MTDERPIVEQKCYHNQYPEVDADDAEVHICGGEVCPWFEDNPCQYLKPPPIVERRIPICPRCGSARIKTRIANNCGWECLDCDTAFLTPKSKYVRSESHA